MGSTSLSRRFSYARGPFVAGLLLAAAGSLFGSAAAQSPDFNFGDGRHGSFTVPPGETTIQDVWSQVRGGSDATAYDPAQPDQVPSLENLTISSGGVLTVSGFAGNPVGAVDPTEGGVLRLKVRGTLTIEGGGAISATGKGYRGGTLEGDPPGRIGQQGDSWGNGGGISGEANRGGGGGGFGEINAANNPGSGGGGGHREGGARGATGQGSETGGLGGRSFDAVATNLGEHAQTFRDTYPFPRFGSGGGRGGQTENFSNTGATGGRGGGVIIIEARHIVNNGAIAADGAPGGSDISGGGGGAGGSIVIQSLSLENGAVSVDGGDGGVGTELGNDGGAGGAGILLWDTRFELDTAVEGEGSVSLSPSGGLYSANAVVDVTAEPAAGWAFDRWEGDLAGSLNPDSLTMDGDKLVTAVFVELPALDVTPTVRDIGPSGGNLSFNVEVTGSTDAIDWTSVVETGSEFITINSGATGTNDDVIAVTVARNELDAARTGTIAVSSEDVAGDPVIITINQGPATPALSVTPIEATASAEGDELVFQVRNAGTGSFDWTASLLTGQAFAAITSGNTGSNVGTVVVTVTENLSALQRTATVSISAPGALNAPTEITIVQQAGVPLLQVTPSTQLIGSAAGSASLTVNNGGNGTMNWTATVIEGADFATITGGSDGTDAGSITIAFQGNTTLANRTARVRVESLDAANSPVDVSITQTSQESVLQVTPETQTVGSRAGTASYQVQNTGTGTMNWTASVESGANFVTISDGVSGANDGTVSLAVDENTSTEDRTATIRIEAPGAANSPRTVTLVQTSRAPVLRVVPAEQSIGSNGGAVNITIENGGTGTLSWTASLAEGAEFLSITSAANGTDDGTIQVSVETNSEGESRTGTVRIEAPGASESPQTATILQLGCPLLDRPENLAASDGHFADAVELIWSAVPNAQEYEVFRSPRDEPERRQLIGTTGEPRFTDSLAEPPDYDLVRQACFNPGEFIITPIVYSYEVKAINACGASAFSVPDTGYRGLPPRETKQGQFIEDRLPAAPAADGKRAVHGEHEVALRLAGDIAPASIWGQVDGAALEPGAVQWIPAADGGGWAILPVPDGLGSGDSFVADAGAITLTGEPIAASGAFLLAEAGAKADGVHTLPYLTPDETKAQFEAGLGDVYRIAPSTAFAEAQWIRLPVPDGAEADSLTLYYFGENADGTDWYPASGVVGWLDAPVALSEDGAYVEAWVNHGGVVRVGRVPGTNPPAALSGAILPTDYGTLALLLATVAALGLAGRRFRPTRAGE